MADEVLYDLGVDLDSSFGFHDGDLKLVSYNDNLAQAVVNRLNTRLNELDLFYDDYGSILRSFFGWQGNDVTIDLIKTELNTVLHNEDRLENYSSNIGYDGNGKLRITLILNPSLTNTIELNLVAGDTELEIVDMVEE